MKNCLNCNAPMKRRTRYTMIGDTKVGFINPFCSEECGIEYYREMYLMIGYSDGYEDAFETALKELELNIKYIN